jgi:hypothetical protein
MYYKNDVSLSQCPYGYLWSPVMTSGRDVGQALMLWTGYVDKLGNEIYEGDIVRDDSYRIFICEWNHGSFEWRDYKAWKQGYYDAYIGHREFMNDIPGGNTIPLIIIGNIHEIEGNEELLK